jgi:hypothetical protein
LPEGTASTARNIGFVGKLTDPHEANTHTHGCGGWIINVETLPAAPLKAGYRFGQPANVALTQLLEEKMQTKQNDFWAVSDELISNTGALPSSGSNVVVLDEDSLEDASGGAVGLLVAFAAGYLFRKSQENNVCR